MAQTRSPLPVPAVALRALRIKQGLTLRALAARIGVPFSTLSKLENGKVELTYDKLFRLAQGLGVDIGDLVTNTQPAEPPPSLGRRSVARAGEPAPAKSANFPHHYVATELLGKVMVPVIIEVQAQSVNEMGGLFRHSGEEYLYVLKGAMDLHSDLYAPLRLCEGDSVYFDSAMAHAYVRVGAEPCTVLSVCTGSGIQRLAQTPRLGASPSNPAQEPEAVSKLET